METHIWMESPQIRCEQDFPQRVGGNARDRRVGRRKEWFSVPNAEKNSQRY